MKILIIGLLAFLSWSALTSYLYVCKIKGLCAETETVMPVKPVAANFVTPDTVMKLAVPAKAVIPENLFIYFAFDKSDFSSDAATSKYFEESIAYMYQNLQARLSITGHTDAVGSEMYNKALGLLRAQKVQTYFVGRGVPADKIIIESKGEKDPAEDNSTASGRAINRRAAITIKN
jgi:outer membrane protein OmpA-like peptidoglycan-associated protein